MRPMLKAEPVRRKTRIEAAREVTEEPMVEISWPVHINEKFRLRNTVKGEGETAVAVELPV